MTNWKEIHPDFTLELQKEWENRGFDYEKTKEWINVNIGINDYNFASYLRDTKKFNSQQLLDTKKLKNYQELKNRCNEFNWCHKCQQLNTSVNWCHYCVKKELEKLTGQELIEKFIQSQQMMGVINFNRSVSDKDHRLQEEKIKWIPYEQFTDTEKIGEGGYSKIYKAKWKDRIKHSWESEYVVLKSLNNSQNITFEFLQEIANTNLAGSESTIARCYGISQNPITKNYLIVTQYMEDGNLWQYLKNNTSEMNWGDRLWRLWTLSYGLKIIHKRGLIHRDFHSGNILNNGYYIYITDLGLCRHADEKSTNKLYGILPYLAPELLRKKDNEPVPYSQEADIYSFGIVAYELLANTYPYTEYQELSDNELASKICQGLRPNLDKLLIPQLLKDLIKKCWSNDLSERPSTNDLHKNLKEWWEEDKDEKDTKFTSQLREIKIYNQNLPKEVRIKKYKISSRNVFHSQPISTKEISELLKKLQLNDENSSHLTEISEQIKSIKKEISTFKEPLDNEKKELVDNFIGIKKQSLKDENNEELRNKVWKLEEELEEQGLVTQDLEKLIKVCERINELEQQQIETEQLQTNIEIPTK